MLRSRCTLLQLYCYTTVVNVNAAHSENGGIYTNVQCMYGKLSLSARNFLDEKQDKS